MRITCVGAGPAGLYFAVLAKLRNPTDEITICERHPAGSSYGWGVTFGPGLLHELYANDVESARSIEKATFRWRDQFVHIRGERVTYDGGVDVYNLNRPRLVEILAERARQLGVHIRYDDEVTSQDHLPDADLIVAADGVNSRMRQSGGNFGTEVSPSGDRYIWLGTDRQFSAFAYYFAKTPHGWIWASSYGVQSELSTFVVQCDSETWAGLGFDTMQASDTLAVLGEMFKDQLAGHRLMGQVDDEANARWLSFRNVTNERWHDGNVVLIGDSAHTTHFSAGLGTTLALEDAIALARNLGQYDSLDSALTAYERQRRAEMAKAQNQARLSARWFADIDRYLDLEPHKFATLLHARRSPLLPLLPPRLYYQVHRALREVPILRQLRPVARAIRHRIGSSADRRSDAIVAGGR